MNDRLNNGTPVGSKQLFRFGVVLAAFMLAVWVAWFARCACNTILAPFLVTIVVSLEW